jgi:hypothetical protein
VWAANADDGRVTKDVCHSSVPFSIPSFHEMAIKRRMELGVETNAMINMALTRISGRAEIYFEGNAYLKLF